MAAIEGIVRELECQKALSLLCSALDRGDNAEAAGFFTDDAVIVAPNGQELAGPAARKFVLGRSAAIITRHLLTNVLVTLDGSERAHAEAYVHVYRVHREEPSKPSSQSVGELSVDFRMTDVGWRVSRYRATPFCEIAS